MAKNKFGDRERPAANIAVETPFRNSIFGR